MGFDLVFKRCTSPVNKFDKAFQTTTQTFECVLKENTDIFRPTFIISSGADLWNYNYIDGSDFSGRQYFITDIRSIGNGLFEVDAKTDVLSTWKSQIRSNTAVIRRQEGKYNLYLDDPEFHIYNSERIQTLKLTNSEFSKTLKYVLVVNGS